VTEDPLLERENIYLPVSALYPNNTLAIDFDFSENGHAEPSGRGPEASILPGSFIDLRGVPRFVQLPRLDLFAQAGFPFTRIADMSETAAILPAHPGADQLSMFLDMMGRFGGETGSPGTRITVLEPDRAEEAEHKDLLVLGSPDRQPLFSQWSGHLPLTIGAGQLHVNQPLGLWGLLAHVPFSASAREYRRLGDLLSGGELPDGVIEGLPSPLDSTRSAVLMATVGSGQTFQPLISAFGGDVNLAEVHGGISLLQAGRFYSFDLSRGTNSIGRLSWREIFNNWMAANFWLIAVLAVLCALPIARWLYRWSERRAEKRLRPRTHAFATAKERPAACGVAPPI
jgi:cellulose synthase (UDP-forming)